VNVISKKWKTRKELKIWWCKLIRNKEKELINEEKEKAV
jgi:hypothetical protein